MGGSQEEEGIKLVGARGFEPPTSASRTLRANQAALRPASIIIGGFNLFGKDYKLKSFIKGRLKGLRPFKNNISPSPY